MGIRILKENDHKKGFSRKDLGLLYAGLIFRPYQTFFENPISYGHGKILAMLLKRRGEIVFLPHSRIEIACHPGLSDSSPLLGGAGLGSIGLPAG